MVAAGCAAAGAPILDSIEPTQGARGSLVELRGDGFCVNPDCSDTPVGAVDFGVEIPQVRASVVTWSAGAITAVVPQSLELGSIEVLVTVEDRSSNAIEFEVLPGGEN